MPRRVLLVDSMSLIRADDWKYVYEHQHLAGTPGNPSAPASIWKLSPLEGFVSADIKCAHSPPYKPTPPPANLSCHQSTGCSPGVCASCCNDFIVGDACQQCVEQRCNNCRCAYRAYPSSKVPAHTAMAPAVRVFGGGRMYVSSTGN